MDDAFGVALRKLRGVSSLSQEQLAEKSGLHRTYISLLERGEKSPTLTTICKLASALGVTPHNLVQEAEQILEGEPHEGSSGGDSTRQQ
jgi:transcriptional regulator with XRE-family HTH domain